MEGPPPGNTNKDDLTKGLSLLDKIAWLFLTLNVYQPFVVYAITSVYFVLLTLEMIEISI